MDLCEVEYLGIPQASRSSTTGGILFVGHNILVSL
jgi:hypothetical protein